MSTSDIPLVVSSFPSASICLVTTLPSWWLYSLAGEASPRFAKLAQGHYMIAEQIQGFERVLLIKRC